MANRCFSSSQLYALRNEINVQMLVRQADFVQSGKFLQSMFQKDSACPERGNHGVISGSNPQDGSRMKRSTLSGQSDSGPCHIGKILGSVLPSDNGCISSKRAAQYKPAKPEFAPKR